MWKHIQALGRVGLALCLASSVLPVTAALLGCASKQAQVADVDPKYRISPSKNPQNPKKLYVPLSLEDCFPELQKMLHPDLVEEMRSNPESGMINHHFGLGRWMRNEWGLWKGSRLSKYFNELGINHPDDMSGIILDSFWRYLNDRPIELEQQIKYYQDFWKDQQEQMDSSRG